MFLSNKFPKKG